MTVYTGGSFDLFHAGHVNLLREASRLGEVTVGLNTDAFIRKYKRRFSVVRYDERREVLLACRYVSNVVPCDGDSVTTIAQVKPDYLVIGSDWATRDYYAQMGFDQDWLDQRGITLVYVPYTRGVSTTELRGRLT